MFTKALSFLATTLMASSAFAAADLTVAISPTPSGTYVNQTARYTVTVANTGNRDASNASVVIQLPATHTSPQVYVMGTIGSMSTRCTQSGTALTCALGTVRKARSTSVFVDIALPQSSAALTFGATVSTTSAENSTANNTASRSASLLNYAQTIAIGDTATNAHCTGTLLTSFFECALFPSSITAYAFGFDDGTLSFPTAPATVTAEWYQPSATELVIDYADDGQPAASFHGWGTSPSCFEGITTFPGSTYVSPYRVCID